MPFSYQLNQAKGMHKDYKNAKNGNNGNEPTQKICLDEQIVVRKEGVSVHILSEDQFETLNKDILSHSSWLRYSQLIDGKIISEYLLVVNNGTELEFPKIERSKDIFNIVETYFNRHTAIELWYKVIKNVFEIKYRKKTGMDWETKDIEDRSSNIKRRLVNLEKLLEN